MRNFFSVVRLGDFHLVSFSVVTRLCGYLITHRSLPSSRHLCRGTTLGKDCAFLLKMLCSLDYVVEGLQHLPKKNAVILLKHSSTFEGLAQVLIFPRQTWVIKKS